MKPGLDTIAVLVNNDINIELDLYDKLAAKKMSRTRSLTEEAVISDCAGVDLCCSDTGPERRSKRKRPPRKYQPHSPSKEEYINSDNRKYVRDEIGKAIKIDIMCKNPTSKLHSIKVGKMKTSPNNTMKNKVEDVIMEDDIVESKKFEIRSKLTSKDIKKIKKMLPVKCKLADKQFKCKVCKEGFTQSSSLATHIRRVHNKEKKKKCPHCGQAFACTGDLTRHIRIHTGERPFVCTIEDCKKGFTTSGALYKHIRKHAGLTKKLVCSLCNENFITQYELKRHTKLKHPNIKDFNCEQCGKSFSRKDELALHMRRHEGIKPHRCVCGKSYTDSSNFYVHLRATLHMDINIEKGKSKS